MKFFNFAILALSAQAIKIHESEEMEKLQEVKVNSLSGSFDQKCETGQTAKIHYTGALKDGTVFDSSIPRGEAIQFVIGDFKVIKCWE